MKYFVDLFLVIVKLVPAKCAHDNARVQAKQVFPLFPLGPFPALPKHANTTGCFNHICCMKDNERHEAASFVQVGQIYIDFQTRHEAASLNAAT